MAYGATDPKSVSPTPPLGPTTYTALVAMVVGVIISALALFDIVPTPEKVQAIGVIVGAVISLVAFVVSAISRTRQATNLAKLAQAERAANPLRLAAGGKIADAPLIFTRPDGKPALGYTHPENVREGAAGSVKGVSLTPTTSADEPMSPMPSALHNHDAGRRSTDQSDHDTTPRPASEIRKEMSE